MKRHLVNGGAVHLGLCHCEEFKDGDRARSNGGFESTVMQSLAYVTPTTMMTVGTCGLLDLEAMSGQGPVIVPQGAHLEVGLQTTGADGLVQWRLPIVVVVEHGRGEHIASHTTDWIQVNMHASPFTPLGKGVEMRRSLPIASHPRYGIHSASAVRRCCT